MTDAEPRATVIIVNYNSSGTLDACLSSVIRSLGPRDEVLLFDNGSTDGSVERVEQSFPQVQIIRSEENLGFAAGNNQAARRANGQDLAFLNPDTTTEAGWLDALIAALAADGTVGLVTSKILQMDKPDRVSGCGNDVHCSGLALGRGMGLHRDVFSRVEEVAAISGASFAVRKEVFDTIGGFDGDFFMYVEDTDLSFRTWLAGYRLLYVPESVVYHDYTLHFGPDKTFYQERNRYIMLLKSLRWPTLFLSLPAVLLAEVVTWGFVLLRERRHLRNKLSAYAWVITHWSNIMRKRRRVQHARRLPDRDLLWRLTHRLAYEQTGRGALPQLAHLVFDPLFFLSHRFALLTVRW
jgi:GT2 family glycosyltransferase